MAVQLPKDQATWLEFNILDSSGDPIILVEETQVRVFYKKYGDLEFTQYTPLVAVDDPSDPQDGENFVEIGFGVYAIYFTASFMDTLDTFTWVVIPDNPDNLDFKQWTQQVDIIFDGDYGAQLDSIQSTVENTETAVDAGFDDVTVDVAALQAAVDSMRDVIDAVQDTVESIEGGQPSGINVSFT